MEGRMTTFRSRDGTPVETSQVVDLYVMTKEQLIAHAIALEIVVPEGLSKRELIALIGGEPCRG